MNEAESKTAPPEGSAPMDNAITVPLWSFDNVKNTNDQLFSVNTNPVTVGCLNGALANKAAKRQAEGGHSPRLAPAQRAIENGNSTMFNQNVIAPMHETLYDVHRTAPISTITPPDFAFDFNNANIANPNFPVFLPVPDFGPHVCANQIHGEVDVTLAGNASSSQSLADVEDGNGAALSDDKTEVGSDEDLDAGETTANESEGEVDVLSDGNESEQSEQSEYWEPGPPHEEATLEMFENGVDGNYTLECSDRQWELDRVYLAEVSAWFSRHFVAADEDPDYVWSDLQSRADICANQWVHVEAFVQWIHNISYSDAMKKALELRTAQDVQFANNAPVEYRNQYRVRDQLTLADHAGMYFIARCYEVPYLAADAVIAFKQMLRRLECNSVFDAATQLDAHRAKILAAAPDQSPFNELRDHAIYKLDNWMRDMHLNGTLDVDMMQLLNNVRLAYAKVDDDDDDYIESGSEHGSEDFMDDVANVSIPSTVTNTGANVPIGLVFNVHTRVDVTVDN